MPSTSNTEPNELVDGGFAVLWSVMHVVLWVKLTASGSESAGKVSGNLIVLALLLLFRTESIMIFFFIS